MMPKGQRSGRPVSQLNFDLLQLSSAYPDYAAWCRVAAQVTAKYPRPLIDRGLSRLMSDGLISTTGSPTSGWLTTRGKAALERNRA